MGISITRIEDSINSVKALLATAADYKRSYLNDRINEAKKSKAISIDF
jgi:hypothetical protein